MDWKNAVRFLAARGKEPSTYRGLVALAGIAGVTLGPETVQAVSAAGIALAGLAGVLMPDPKPAAGPGVDFNGRVDVQVSAATPPG